jgi:predicted transcriptional regulator of viral defense system
VGASGEARTAGIEHRLVDGVEIPITDSAKKTLADCFKHPIRTGLDVTVEAVRDLKRRGCRARQIFAATPRSTACKARLDPQSSGVSALERAWNEIACVQERID